MATKGDSDSAEVEALRSIPDATIAQWVASDAELKLAAKDLKAVVTLELGARALRFRFDAEAIALDETDTDPDVRISGAAAAWNGFLAPTPAPGFESLSAAARQGLALIGANDKLVASYHFAFQRLAELLREGLHSETGGDVTNVEAFFAPTDTAIGRYVRVSSGGQTARIYYEEAGSSDTALLLLHTAGGDNRQWRFLLADPELQKRYRIVALDLPFHGKSLPPQGTRWWETGYAISREQLMDWVVNFAAAIGLDRPIFMGCSVGGNLALDLAADRKDHFRAFIALNGWHDMRPLKGFSNDRFRTPAISENLFLSLIYGATAPNAPKYYRQEVRWVYASNVKGIYAGDNDYFLHGHDLGENGHKIDTRATPVFALTGTYDGSVHFPGHDAAAAAERIPGIVYREMPRLGHFMPSDNPMEFRAQILPVLAEIERALGASVPT